MGQLHQRGGGGVLHALLGHLDLAETTEQLGVAMGAVADQEALLAGGEQLGRQVVGRAQLGPAQALHAPRHLAVEGVEELVASSVDGGHDESGGVAGREREQVEALDPDHRHAQRMGQRLARGQPDPEPGEQPGADIDRDHADLGQLDAGLPADEVDLRGEALGVAPAPRRVGRGEHPLVTADGAAHLDRRRSRCRGSARGQPSPSVGRGVGLLPARQGHGRLDRLLPARPAGADAADLDGAVVVAIAEGEAHLEQVGGKHRVDRVTPLDQGDTARSRAARGAPGRGLASRSEIR